MIQIFAIEKTTNRREEITNLYWFEENGVEDWGGHGIGGEWRFEIFVNGIQVYPVKE